MTDRERLRLAWALLDEALAIADGEAGSDNDLVRRWADKVNLARLEYRDSIELGSCCFAGCPRPWHAVMAGFRVCASHQGKLVELAGLASKVAS